MNWLPKSTDITAILSVKKIKRWLRIKKENLKKEIKYSKFNEQKLEWTQDLLQNNMLDEGIFYFCLKVEK